MTVYRSASKAGAHRRVTRMEKIIDWFRELYLESVFSR